MSIVNKILYTITKNETYVLKQTDNGLQPEDPKQDVNQNKKVQRGDK